MAQWLGESACLLLLLEEPILDLQEGRVLFHHSPSSALSASLPLQKGSVRTLTSLCHFLSLTAALHYVPARVHVQIVLPSPTSFPPKFSVKAIDLTD